MQTQQSKEVRDRIYLNSTYKKQEFYRWAQEELEESQWQTELKTIAYLESQGNFEEAFSKFKDVVYELRNPDNQSWLRYYINDNAEMYGEEKTILDFYQGLMRISTVKERKDGEVIEKEVIKKTYGYSKGKRVRAIKERFIIKGKMQTKIRDIKTGRFVSGRKK